jgi:hypothetical protein
MSDFFEEIDRMSSPESEKIGVNICASSILYSGNRVSFGNGLSTSID